MKILIWDKGFDLKNSGGPSGYLYNIKKYLDIYPCDQIDFYTDKIVENKKNSSASRKQIKKILSSFLMNFGWGKFILAIYRSYYKFDGLTLEEKNLVEKYDFVHIHWLSQISESFRNFKGKHTKIILTTHTPEPLIDELAGIYGQTWLLKFFPIVREQWIKKELNIYGLCDYIMFPVAEACEVYTNSSELFKKKFTEINERFFYVPTALFPTVSPKRNAHILDKYKIPTDALKICYIGRHTKVKGYDTLCSLAMDVWKKESNVYFIIGGKEEPLKGLNDHRWIELGWVDTQALLNEVDVFILPNKDTYFDLILLEVLRQGLPIVLTETGGNKWFKQYDSKGIMFYQYNDCAECASIVMELYEKKRDKELEKMGEANIQFFNRCLTMDNYLNSYIEQLQTKLKNCNS